MIDRLNYTQIAEHILKLYGEGIALVFREGQETRVLFQVCALEIGTNESVQYYEEIPHQLRDQVEQAAHWLAGEYVNEGTCGTPEGREARAFAWFTMAASIRGARETAACLGAAAEKSFGNPIKLYETSPYGQAWLRINEAIKARVKAAERKKFEDQGDQDFEGLKGY